jgi:replicative DNA helicase
METFDFGDSFQDLILACLLKHPKKFFSYGRILDARQFVGVQATITARAALKYFEEHSRFPTWRALEELVSDEARRLETSSVKDAQEYVQKISAINTGDADYVAKKVVDFARERSVLAAVRKTIELIQSNKLPEGGVVKMFEDALGIGQNLDELGYIFHEDAENVIDTITQRQYGIHTGFPLLDRIWRNGWGPGWLIALLAPPKRWKTMTSIQLALNMIGPSIGKNVFYYPCEISQELALVRALLNLTGLPQEYLYEAPEKFKEAVKLRMPEHVHGHLLWKSFPSGMASIQDIKLHAKTAVQQLEIKPDAIFIDYAENIRSTSKSDRDYRQQADIYTEARALGHEFSCPIIMPDRCNAETVNAAVPNMKSFQGAFQKAGIVDVGIGLCATDEEYLQNVVRFFVFLNRHGKAYQHLRGKVEPELMRIFLDEEIPYDPGQEEREDSQKKTRRRRSLEDDLPSELQT